MISFPLYFLLFAYLLFLCVFIIFSLINAYHIVSTGMLTIASFTITVITITLTATTLYFTWQHIVKIDWKQPFVLLEEKNSITTDF